jgi:methyl-accepting chemotaxis protein
MKDLRRIDRDLHGRDGYMVSELIRQLIQIRFGEPLSEEAKGKAWDKNRLFSVDEFGTTENLLSSMASTLRTAVPKLVSLSPTLADAIEEIEAMIRRMHSLRE